MYVCMYVCIYVFVYICIHSFKIKDVASMKVDDTSPNQEWKTEIGYTASPLRVPTHPHYTHKPTLVCVYTGDRTYVSESMCVCVCVCACAFLCMFYQRV